MENQPNTSPSEDEQKQTPPAPVTPPAEAEKADDKANGKVNGEQTPPQQFSQEDVDKLLAGHEARLKTDFDAKRTEHDSKYKAEMDKLQASYQETLERMEQQETATLLKRIEAEGGDVNLARELAESRRSLNAAQRKFEGEQRELDAQRTQITEGMRVIDAERLSKKHGVDKEPLLKASNPVEMENIALSLALEKKESEKTPPQKTDGGLQSEKGVDLSNMSIQQRLRWLAEKGQI